MWLVWVLVLALVLALIFALVFGLIWGPVKRSAGSSRLTLIWPSTRRQLVNFLSRAGRGLGLGLVAGLVFGLVVGLILGLGLYGSEAVGEGPPWLASGLGSALGFALGYGLVVGLIFGLIMGLGSGLLEPRAILVTSRTPKEARSRSLIAALTWLVSGLVLGLVVDLGLGLGLAFFPRPSGLVFDAVFADLSGQGGYGLGFGLGFGLGLGLILALRNDGWFLLLQRTAHHSLAQGENLPPHPYDFLEWGLERQVFRRVGGSVRFRHNLIQQHLAQSHQAQPCEMEARSETRGPKVVLAGVFLSLAVLDTAWGLWGANPNTRFAYRLAFGLGMATHDLLRLGQITLIMLVVSGVGYLVFMRRQGVAFRKAIFNWPVVAVTAVVALLLLFTDLSFLSLL